MHLHQFGRRFRQLLKGKITGVAGQRRNHWRLHCRPDLERLEVRTAPAVYTVTGTADGLGTITSTGPDTFDASTLRAAVIAANADAPAADTIIVPAGTYRLTVPPTVSDDEFSGDLNVTNSVSIQGAGADSTIIDANQLDRAFDIGVTGTVSLSGLTITNGNALEGGGIENFGSNSSVTLSNSTLSGNTAVSAGGGIANEYGGNLSLNNCTVSRNSAALAGGIVNDGELGLSSCTLSNNSAGADGGGIINMRTLGLSNCTLSGNSTVGGTAGGIRNYGIASVSDSTLSGNSAAVGGGIENDGMLSLSNCTLSGNSAAVGGGILNAAMLNLTNCTLYENSAQLHGGGIANDDITATATLRNCTLSGNSATLGGGVANDFSPFSTVIVANSILAKNVAGSLGPDLFGSIRSLGFNLVGNATGIIGFPAAGDRIGVDPLLGSLEDNGGPTWTMALLPCSPAIDAGSNALAIDPQGNTLTTDQRGFARIVNGTVDIGAFEFSPVFLSPTNHVLTLTACHPGDTITISNAPNDFFDSTGVLVVTVNGTEFDFHWSDVTGGINIDTYMGGATVNIENVSEGTPVAVTTRGGNNAIKVSPVAQSLDSFNGSLTVDSQDGNDSLHIWDLNGLTPLGRTYNLTSNILNINLVTNRISVDDLPELSISYSNVANLLLQTDGLGSTVNVQGEAATSSVTIHGGVGDDNLVIDFSSGNPIPPDGFCFDGNYGSGAYGADSLTLNGNPFLDETYTASGPASGSIDFSNGDGATFTITYSNVETLNDLSLPALILLPNQITFNATNGDDAINVVDGPQVDGFMTTQISSGGTFATLNFANRNDVIVNTLGGVDNIELNDPNPEAGLSDLTVNVGASNGDIIPPSTVNVDATAANTLTTINADGAFDQVTVSPSAENLETIRGSLTVAGPGLGALTLDDENNPWADTYTLTGSSVSRQFVASITYSGLSNISLYGGRGLGRTYQVTNTVGGLRMTTIYAANPDDLVNVEATTGSLTINLLAMSGNPIVDVSSTAQNLDAIEGSVAVNGQYVSGQCFGSVILDDQQAPVVNSYTLQATSFSRANFGGLSYSSLGGLIINAAPDSNVLNPQPIYVLATSAGTTTTINAANGWHNIFVGLPDGNPLGIPGTGLDAILGAVTVSDQAYRDELVLYDSAGKGQRTYSLNSTSIAVTVADGVPIAAPVPISWKGFLGIVTLFGTPAADKYELQSLANNLVDLQAFGAYTQNTFESMVPDRHTWKVYSNNSVTTEVSPGSNQFVIFGGVYNFTGGPGGDDFQFTPNYGHDGGLAGMLNGNRGTLDYSQDGSPISVYVATISPMDVNGERGSATNLGGGFSNIRSVIGNNSSTTLIGPDGTNNYWSITGAYKGNLARAQNQASNLAFSQMPNLTGGAMNDTFAFQPGGSISGIVDGRGGTNMLDYSKYTGNITVDLSLNLASLVNQGAANGVFNIANVTGSIGSDLLVGDANPNILIGGTGRNVIIGGAGGDTLDAHLSSGDNILIGGRTDWDSNLAALNAIFAEWTRTDLGPMNSFQIRYNDLLSGTGSTNPMNKLPDGTLVLLTPATNKTSSNGRVHADSSPDTLIGSNGIDPTTSKRVHNWFFYDSDDMIVNLTNPFDRKNKVT
jgi:hypothetical protein